MLKIKKILFQVENNIDSVIAEDTHLGKDLWRILLDQHYADIAALLARLEYDHQIALFKKLPLELSAQVFRKLQEEIQVQVLVVLADEHAAHVLNAMPIDELTDLFDYLSDEELNNYFKLVQQKRRRQIISLMNFDPRSAGGRMNINVLTLQKDFTVKKSIELLQRIGHYKTITERLFVTNREHVLQGFIKLDQLVLSKPDTLLSNILKETEMVVYADEDQEDVANQMHHYGLMVVPVVDKRNLFLGVITADDVFEIIKQEGSEDVYRMFGLVPIENSYFMTSFWSLIMQRGSWLCGLFLFQSFSSLILASYQSLLDQYTIIAVFLTMLIGTGGNAGNQSATLVIRGLTTREMSRANAMKVLFREFNISLIIAFVLSVICFARVMLTHNHFMSAVAISLSLFLIVVASIFCGSLIPLLLDRLGVDPAHSAAPFLATLMDILGVLIYCFVCSKFLSFAVAA